MRGAEAAPRRPSVKTAIAAVALLLLGRAETSSAWAQAPPAAESTAPRVAVSIVLAVDASGSVSPERFDLQKLGYAQAFRDPRVLRVIFSRPGNTIAVTMTQWTGPNMQVQVIPWTLVRDDAAASRIADSIAATRRLLTNGGTSISGAIDHAVGLLAQCPCRSDRRVIDISGDGANNNGRPASEARDAALAADIVINGLPILVLEPNLETYYRDNVIGGPGAFVIATKSYDQFADAIVRKLVLEIAGDTVQHDRRAEAPH